MYFMKEMCIIFFFRDLLKDTSETKQRTIQAFEHLKEEAERRLQTACLQKDSEISQTQELHNKIVIYKLI